MQASRGTTLRAFRSMPNLDDILEDIVNMVVPREGWVKHDSKILKLIDSAENVIARMDSKAIYPAKALVRAN